MQKRIAIKNHTEEIRLITQRAFAAFIIIGLLVFFLIFRLGYLQLSKHDMYTTLSKKNWLDLVPLEPTRGLIYDRHGVLLAENLPVFSLDAIPYKIQSIPKMLADISRIVPLSDTDIAQFQKQLKEHRRFEEIPLKFRLSEVEVAKFYESQYKFPGLIIRARLMRHYPLGESFSHVLGYVGRINVDELKNIDQSNYSATNYIGKLGIEKFYEGILHGTVGYEQAENDASGEPVRVLKQIDPTPGKNLTLSIDSGLQLLAEQALDGFRGAVVAIEPSTGQILALVSHPSFDPNIFVDGISSKDFQELQQSSDRPLYNRALRGLYPPASTVKPFIALEGLESGVITPNTTINDPGWYQLNNSSHIFHDWRHHGHGVVNLLRAITGSCDTYFYDLAFHLGINRIDDVLSQFGFGDMTGIDLSEELSGTLASPEWKRKRKHQGWYEGDTLNSGIGQGFMQTTPLQLAMGIATIANRGARFTPQLVLSEQMPGKTSTPHPIKSEDPIDISDAAIWTNVINAMQNVIDSPEGTGYRFGRTPYTVAAKTGTAQVYSISAKTIDRKAPSQASLPERLRDNSLLIAFAPVDHPRIAIAIVVENSSLAITAENHGPAIGIARKLFDYYLMPAFAKPLQEAQAKTQPQTAENITHDQHAA